MESVIILWLLSFITMLGIGLIAPLMSKYAQSIGATNFEIGVIFGSFAIARTIAQIPVSYFSDKYGKKIFLLIGTFFYGVFTIMYPFVNSVFQLMILRTLNGIFSSFINPVAGAYVATVAPKEKLGEYMGLFNSAVSLGFSMGPLIGGIMAEYYGMKAPFYFCGLLSFISFIICYFKLKNIRVNKDGSFTYLSKLIVKHNKPSNKKSFSLEFLKNRCFLFACTINTLYIIVSTGIIAYLAIYASNFHMGLDQIGILIASTNLTSGALQRKFGKIFDSSTIYGNFTLYGGLLLGALGLYMVSMLNSLITFSSIFSPFIWMFIALEILAIGGAMCSPAINSLAMKDIDNEKKGMAMGLFTTSLNVGMFLGAILLGFLADLFGLSNMYKISAIALALTGIYSYFFIKKYKNKK